MENILNKINRSALKFLQIQTLNETYNSILNEALKLVRTEYGAIYIEKNGEFNLAYASSKELLNIKPKNKGYLYKSFKLNKSFVLDVSITNFEVSAPEIINKKIKSILYIPLSFHNKSIGVLALFSKKDKYFTKNEICILELFGSMASLAIGKTTTRYEMEKALKDKNIYRNIENSLLKINKSALKFLFPLKPNETYPTIVLEAIKLVKGDYGSLTLEENGEFKQVFSTLPINVKRRKKGLTYKSFKERKVIIIDSQKNIEFSKVHPEFIENGIRSIINIPLSYRGKAIGVLVVNSKRKQHFKRKELDILKPYGAMASLAIRKAQLYNETQKALEARDRFISMAAHELRTPLTTINGYVQMLHQKLSKKDSQETRWTEELLYETRRLTSLINELLEINRIKTGKLNYMFQECKIKNIIEKAISSFQFNHRNRNVLLENLTDDKNSIIGDPDKLEQVITNILDNAAKFSSANSEISLKLESNSKFTTIVIKDHGEGIAKDDIPKVINGFYLGNKNTENGMGLGYYLINNIIRIHRGNLKIKSRPKKGTVVEIKLPVLKT